MSLIKFTNFFIGHYRFSLQLYTSSQFGIIIMLEKSIKVAKIIMIIFELWIFTAKKILFHVSSNCVSGELFENVRTTQKVGIIEELFL